VPYPEGSYPALLYGTEGPSPLYFTFSFDHGIPYNPVKVLSPHQRWDFAVKVRADRHRRVAEMTNLCNATIPVELSWYDRYDQPAPKKVMIKGRSTVTIQMQTKCRTLDFYFSIYDKAAIWPKGANKLWSNSNPKK